MTRNDLARIMDYPHVTDHEKSFLLSLPPKCTVTISDRGVAVTVVKTRRIKDVDQNKMVDYTYQRQVVYPFRWHPELKASLEWNMKEWLKRRKK